MTRPMRSGPWRLLLAVAVAVVGVGAGLARADGQQDEKQAVKAKYDAFMKQGTEHATMRRFEQAVAPFQEALKVLESIIHVSEPYHPDIVQLHYLLGELHLVVQDYGKARRYLSTARQLWEKNIGSMKLTAEGASAYVGCLEAQAHLLRSLGAYGEAVEHCERAMQILHEAKIDKTFRAGQVLFEYGQIRNVQRKRKEARDCLTQALQLMTNCTFPVLGTSAVGQAGAAQPREGLLAAAAIISGRESQVDMAYGFIAPVRRVLAGTLINLKRYDDLDVLGEAETLLADLKKSDKEALDACKDPGTRDLRKHGYASTLVSIAAVHFERKDHARARATLLEAKRVFESGDARKAPGMIKGLANCLVGLAAASLFVDPNDDKAEGYLVEAMRLRSLVGLDRDWAVRTRLDLGLVYLLRQKKDAALRELGKALEDSEETIAELFPYLNERQRLVFLTEQRVVLDVWLTAAEVNGVPDDEIAARIVKWKGRSFSRNPVDAIRRRHPDAKPLLDQYCAACQTLSLLHAVRRPQDRLWVRKEAEAEKEVRHLEDELWRKKRVRVREEAISPDAISNALPKNIAVVDYIRYGHLQKSRSMPGGVGGQIRLLALVFRNGSKPVCVRMPVKDSDLIRKLTHWRKLLDESPSWEAYPAKLNGEGDRIAQAIWRPLQKHLGNPKLVIVCPEGPLVYLPFAALPGTKSRSYVIDDVDVSYAVSARHVFQMFQAKPEQTERLANKALVVAGVEYPPSMLKAGFADLRDTKEFGVEMTQLFEQSNPGASAVLLSGQGANSERFIKESEAGYRMIACVLHTDRTPSRKVREIGLMEFAGIQHESLDSILDFKLLFAAADKNAPDASPTYLTGLEWAALDRAPECLASFMCEGASGPETIEGASNFIRVGHLAGAQSVVASLWREHIDHALPLAKRFCEYMWQPANPNRAASLCQAQRDHRSFGGANGHPRYWAGWVLSGDVGSMIKPEMRRVVGEAVLNHSEESVAGFWIALGCGIAVASCAVVLWLLYRRRCSTT